jgi:hypothetical protein
VHVGGGASAVLSSCELLRSGLFCGLVAQGRGTRVEGRQLLLEGSRESNVYVWEGATVALQDCRCGAARRGGAACCCSGAGQAIEAPA